MPPVQFLADNHDAGETVAGMLRKRFHLSWKQAKSLVSGGHIRVAGMGCTDIALRIKRGNRVWIRDGVIERKPGIVMPKTPAKPGEVKPPEPKPKRGSDRTLERPQPKAVRKDAHTPTIPSGLELVYSDEAVVVVNKPAGITTMRHADEAAEFGAGKGGFLPKTVLGTLTLWYWRRFGWKWGALVTVTSLIIVGGWQFRNRRIIQQDPPNTHDTYLRQFTLKAPETPHSGRIQMNPKGLALRVSTGFPAYIGMIPRSILNSMSLGPPVWPHVFWTRLFWVLAIPLGGLILVGYVVSAKRGLTLSALFATLFWLFSAMWPWRDARFLVPIVPFFIVFLFLAVNAISNRLRPRIGSWPLLLVQTPALTLLFVYFAHVNADARKESGGPAYPGYALGRIPEEGGFYAACDWLRQNTPHNTLVMGRPAYLLHLYSGHPTVQIEPSESPRGQEKAYIAPKHVQYLLQDVWGWAHTSQYINPYMKVYHGKWELVWKDPRRSGTRIWHRLPDVPGNIVPIKRSLKPVL